MLALIVTGVLAALMLVWALLERRRADRAESRALTAAQELAAAQERVRNVEDAHAGMREVFERASSETLQGATTTLLSRAEDGILKPVRERLTEFQTKIDKLEAQRQQESGGLTAQIAALMQASLATQEEARKLSNALRRGAGVQGRWAEQMLRNVLELAGLQAKIDFEEQASTDTEEGRRRPDVIVRLPNGGVFVIDAKCSLTAFREAQDATDEALREAALIRHAQSLRSHVQGLSQKAYWDQFDASPDFVVMFVPGDGFLAAAFEHLPDLMTEAMDRKVILVTPSSLFALCKAVSYGWRVEKQALNAAEVADLGRELYKRLSVMGGHVAGMGKALQGALGKYNDFVGSLERQVLSQARRFEDLHVEHQGKEIAELKAIDPSVQPLIKLAPSEEPPEAAE